MWVMRTREGPLQNPFVAGARISLRPGRPNSAEGAMLICAKLPEATGLISAVTEAAGGTPLVGAEIKLCF